MRESNSFINKKENPKSIEMNLFRVYTKKNEYDEDYNTHTLIVGAMTEDEVSSLIESKEGRIISVSKIGSESDTFVKYCVGYISKGVLASFKSYPAMDLLRKETSKVFKKSISLNEFLEFKDDKEIYYLYKEVLAYNNRELYWQTIIEYRDYINLLLEVGCLEYTDADGIPVMSQELINTTIVSCMASRASKYLETALEL